MDRGATCVPVWLRDDGLGSDGTGSQRRPNLLEDSATRSATSNFSAPT